MKIVADDKIPYLKGVLEPYAEVVYLPGKRIGKEEVKDADALIIRTRTKCDAALLKDSNVKFIATATIGFDHIDTKFCRKKKIQWTNAPGCNSSSVQQYMAAAILYIAMNYNIPLKDRTLGIIGVGNVGSKVQELAKVLRMNILLNDPPRARAEKNTQFLPFDKVIKESDILTLHVPLKKTCRDNTMYMINAKTFKKMKNEAFIINTSRGAVVNNNDLKSALMEGCIAGAILDVWENEPFIDKELLNLVDLGTPHIAGYSRDGKANGTAMSVRAISRFFNLGIDDWYPENIETPKNKKISIDCSKKGFKHILYKAVSSTYNIEQDSKKLFNNIHHFEYQRGNYPVRREFPAYAVELKNDDGYYAKIFEDLGFKVA